MPEDRWTDEEPALEPADIFLTRGESLVSRLIRFFTRRIGEDRTHVNHVGIVVECGTLYEAVVVEALSTVQRRRLGRYADGSTRVAVFRALNLTPEEKETVVRAAEGYVGRKYGWLKLAAHFLDWLLQGAYVFRRLARMDDYPICSWLVAHSFGKAGKHFGVAPGAADPDDIWDFVTSQREKYALVRPLVVMAKPARPQPQAQTSATSRNP